MHFKFFAFLLALFFCINGLSAQFCIKAGVNIASEENSFSQPVSQDGFNSTNLTGFQFGVMYQAMPRLSGIGLETGALLSQKGSSFSQSDISGKMLKEGYKEMNYIEVPLNLRYHFLFGAIGVYAFGGIYGGYALSAKMVDETTNNTQNGTFPSFTDHVDYGYNFGGGIELFKKMQFGATLSQGLKNTSISLDGLPLPTKTTNQVYSVNLAYLF